MDILIYALETDERAPAFEAPIPFEAPDDFHAPFTPERQAA